MRALVTMGSPWAPIPESSPKQVNNTTTSSQDITDNHIMCYAIRVAGAVKADGNVTRPTSATTGQSCLASSTATTGPGVHATTTTTTTTTTTNRMYGIPSIRSRLESRPLLVIGAAGNPAVASTRAAMVLGGSKGKGKGTTRSYRSRDANSHVGQLGDAKLAAQALKEPGPFPDRRWTGKHMVLC